MHLHARTEVAREAAQVGLRNIRVEPCFLFSPYLYRLAPLAVERHAGPEEMADMGPLRAAIYGPVARHNPLTRGGAVAIALLAVAALIAMLVLGRTRGSREPVAPAEQTSAG